MTADTLLALGYTLPVLTGFLVGLTPGPPNRCDAALVGAAVLLLVTTGVVDAVAVP